MSSDDEIPIHPKRTAHPDQAFVWVGDKELKKLQKAAWEAGWWPETKKNGLMWRAPDRLGHVMLHRTASDHHAFANALSEFRKAGLKV